MLRQVRREVERTRNKKSQKKKKKKTLRLKRQGRRPGLQIAPLFHKSKRLQPASVAIERRVKLADVTDETRLSQIRAGKGGSKVSRFRRGGDPMARPRKVRADAKMDPRSNLLQLRRQRAAGYHSSSSFDSLGDAINEARSQSGLDLRVLASASFDELEEAGGNSALDSKELMELIAARAAEREAEEKFMSNMASASSSSAAPAEADADVEAGEEADQERPQHGFGLAELNPSSGAATDDPLAFFGAGDMSVERIGPEAEEDVEAVIRELHKLGALYSVG